MRRGAIVTVVIACLELVAMGFFLSLGSQLCSRVIAKFEKRREEQ